MSTKIIRRKILSCDLCNAEIGDPIYYEFIIECAGLITEWDICLGCCSDLALVLQWLIITVGITGFKWSMSQKKYSKRGALDESAETGRG